METKNNQLHENPYLLLTPGPLTTSKTVKEAMMQDWCTWDDDYNVNIVQQIRTRLVALATKNTEEYTSVLLQGSGTFGVESVIGSAVNEKSRLLILSNGAYGQRMIQIANILKIDYVEYTVPETEVPDIRVIKQILDTKQNITHIAVVHCETTTGILNPVKEITSLAKDYKVITIVDAMSSFGGTTMDIHDWNIDFLISSANKCIQGVPGFSFVIARRKQMEACKGNARSLSLDLYDQWNAMESGNGKWRYTSPTHVVRAFLQAIIELEIEGGIAVREARYKTNQNTLVQKMEQLGFKPLLSKSVQSHIITSFFSPDSENYSFNQFYHSLKQENFIIYPGKISKSDTFRIGNIGEVYPQDIEKLVETIAKIQNW